MVGSSLTDIQVEVDGCGKQVCGVRLSNNCQLQNSNISVKNSKLPSTNEDNDKAWTVGVNVISNGIVRASGNIIKKCDIQSFGASGDYVKNGNIYWSLSTALMINDADNTEVIDCNLYSNIVAIAIRNSKTTIISNCKSSAGRNAMSIVSSSNILVKNSEMIVDGDRMGYYDGRGKLTICVMLEDSSITINNCIINAKLGADYAFGTYNQAWANIFLSNIVMPGLKSANCSSSTNLYIGARCAISKEDVIGGNVIETNDIYSEVQ